MQALTVFLNEKKTCTASLGDAGILSVDVSLIGQGPDSCFLQVGGFDSITDQHVKWTSESIKVGDVIKIILEEIEQIDEPTERKTVEEMDEWARRLRPKGAKKTAGEDDHLAQLPAPCE